MGFTEALRLVVDADTSGAVTAVKHLGDTSEKELKRSEQSLDKWGNRLTSLGAGMLTFGVAALAGLGAMARESEEANLAVVKLENTLGNMPKLAGQSSAQFLELADSIQSVTAADADAIVEAEALLGTFQLTAEEIKGVTPLVVDYARKFGIDIPDAAVQVGKALDGQVGALKRNGVSIDEVLFKTDRYRAVSEALSQQVGGFAEAEGKTFAGSLERMKNELGDLAEGVGGGAVDAFTTLFSAVENAAGALESISPGAQSAIGKFATFGAVGLIAAGGISTLIGQVIKARENFTALSAVMVRYSSQLVTLGQVGAVVAGLVLIREGLGAINDEVDRADLSKLENQLLDLAESGKVSGETLERVFEGLDLSSQGRADLDDLDDALAKLTARDPEAAAAAFKLIKEQMLEIGATKEQVKGAFDSYNSALAETDTANRTTGEAIEEATGKLDEEAAAADDAAASTENLTSAIEAHADALRAQFDPLFAMVSALNQSKDAADKVAEAQKNLNDALAGGDASKIAEAQQEYDRALGDASESVINLQQAQFDLNDAINRGDVDVGDAKQTLYELAIQQGLTGDQAIAMAGQLGTAADQAAWLGAQDPVVSATMTGVNQVTGDINALKSKLDAIPRDVNIVTRLTNLVPGSLNIPLRATGGPVTAGQPYIVGEKHAELFIPDRNGMIIPNVPAPMQTAAGSGGGGGVTRVSETINIVLDGRIVAETVRRYDRNNAMN